MNMDEMSELASAIVERQWNKDHQAEPHTVMDDNGDLRYAEEVQDEFHFVLDIIDSYVNGDSNEQK